MRYMVRGRGGMKLTEPQHRKLAEIQPGQPAEYPLGRTGHALIRMGLVI